MAAIVEISRQFWPLSWLDRGRKHPVYGSSQGRILDTAARYAQSLGEEVAVVSGRAPVAGRLLFLGGHALGWGGLAVAGYGLLKAANTDILHLVFGAFGLGVLMQLLAGPLIRRGRRVLQPSTAEVLATDKRRPVLLLRSFRNDDSEIVASADARGDGDLGGNAAGTVEDALSPPFQRYGPFIAIGKPGEALPRLGAGRDTFGEADWQGVIARSMDQAVILLLVPGQAIGLASELEAIARRRHSHKLLVLMPPAGGCWPWQNTTGSRRGSAGSSEAERQQRWAKLRAELKELPGFAALPDTAPERLIAVHLSTSGEPVLITGPAAPRAGDYERAIAFAVYGMKCHGKW